MRNKYAVFLICAQALSIPSALADTLPGSETHQQVEIPGNESIIVEFTSTYKPNIAPGLEFTHPEQIEALALWLKEHDGICYLSGHVSTPTNSAYFDLMFDTKLSAARIEVVI